MWDPSQMSKNLLDTSPYLFGFIHLQDMLDTALLNAQPLGVDALRHKMYVQRVPRPCTQHDWSVSGVHST
jgi:hypothetical protein